MNGKIIKGNLSEDAFEGPDENNPGTISGKRHVLKGDVVEALGSADQIIQDARQKAEDIVTAAREESETIRSQARDEGYQAGLEELNQTILDFKRRYREILANAESDLLKLSLKITERIIGRAVELDHNLLLDIIHQALESLKYQKEIRIRVNPSHMEFLKANKLQLYTMLGESKEIDLVGDPLINGNGCIIDTEIGTIDARLETQLKVIEKILQKS